MIKSKAQVKKGVLHTKISFAGVHQGVKTKGAIYVPGSVTDREVSQHMKEAKVDHMPVKGVREVYVRDTSPTPVHSILAGKPGGHGGHGQPADSNDPRLT